MPSHPKDRIYLDHAATTPLGIEAKTAMQPWQEENFGNPSSTHLEGRTARAAIDYAREAVSERLDCLFGELIFTGSGTEAANMAIVGSALSALKNGDPRRTILLGAAEHHCVIHTRDTLEVLGFKVVSIKVGKSADIDLDHLQTLLNDDVLLVSVMHANNEFGTINPIKKVVEMCQVVGALVHCDAVQTFGQLDCNVKNSGVDFLTISSHKIYGPKGIGAIYIKSGNKPMPLIIGGGQEREMRAGTENVANIVGFGAATRAIKPQDSTARDAFESVLIKKLGEQIIWSAQPGIDRLNGHCHFRMPGVPGDSALIRLDRIGIAAGSGAACSSGSLEPSHVLMATGLSEPESTEGLRFTFGKGQDAEIANIAAARVVETLKEIAIQHARHQ